MSNHYIDIYLRVKDERAKLKKLSDGIVNMVRNYKLQTRELRSQIKTQGELVRALGRVGDMNTWFDEKEKLIALKQTLRDVQDSYDRNYASVTKSKNAQSDNVKEMTKFKGELLSIMFLAQAFAKPFTEIITNVLKLTGVFEIFGSIFTIILLPVLLPFIQFLIKMGTWIAKNKDTVGKFVAWLIIFCAVFGTIVAIGSMVLLTLFAIATTAIGGIIGAFIGIAAIVALVIAYIIFHWEDFISFISGIVDFIMNPFYTFFDLIKAVWELIFSDSETKWEDFFSSLGTIIQDSIDRFTGLFTGLYDFVIKPVVEGISDVATSVWDWITGGKQFGGEIKQSGLYYMHAGEEVISNSPAGSQGNTFNNNFNMTNEIGSDYDVSLISRDVSRRIGEQLA